MGHAAAGPHGLAGPGVVPRRVGRVDGRPAEYLTLEAGWPMEVGAVVATDAGSLVVAVVVAFLTSRFALRRERDGRAVAARRAAVLEVQQAVVVLRVARRRYGDATKEAVALRRSGGETLLGVPAGGTDEERTVFEAESLYEAALARLDPGETSLVAATSAWGERSLTAMLSDEVPQGDEAEAFDAINDAVRTVLRSIGL